MVGLEWIPRPGRLQEDGAGRGKHRLCRGGSGWGRALALGGRAGLGHDLICVGEDRSGHWMVRPLCQGWGGHEEVVACVQVRDDGGLYLASAWSPREATGLGEAHDRSGSLCGSRWSIV